MFGELERGSKRSSICFLILHTLLFLILNSKSDIRLFLGYMSSAEGSGDFVLHRIFLFLLVYFTSITQNFFEYLIG